MKRACPHARATWTTKYCRYSGAPAITTLRGIVREQIETGGNKIDELKLCYGPHAHQRRATRGTHDGAFRDRRVDDARFTKFVEQSIRDFERTAVRADVLADHKHGRIAF